MQRFSGLVLIVAGAGIAGFAMLPQAGDGAEQLAEVTRISAAPDRDAPIPNFAPRTFSASNPLVRPHEFAATSPVTTVATTALPAAPVAKATPTTVANGWTTVVVTDPASPAAGRYTSSKPADAATRAELARDIQRELARVGCYRGEINGAWTAQTRRAMAAFMDRANASLPINDPDYVLLTLVQNYGASACGVECPSGQTLAGDGRCVPHAVIAQASRKANREELRRREAEARKSAREQAIAAAQQVEQQRQMAQVARSAEAKFAVDRAVARQRIAEAKAAEPIDADARRAAALNRGTAAAPASRNFASAAVTQSGSDELPWLQDDRAIVATHRAAAPLPGRMAVGAIVDVPETVGVAPPTLRSAPITTSAITPPPARAATGAAVDSFGADRTAAITPPAPRPAVRPARSENARDNVASIEYADDADLDAVAEPRASSKKSGRLSKAKRRSSSARAKRNRVYVYNGYVVYPGRARRTVTVYRRSWRRLPLQNVGSIYGNYY